MIHSILQTIWWNICYCFKHMFLWCNIWNQIKPVSVRNKKLYYLHSCIFPQREGGRKGGREREKWRHREKMFVFISLTRVELRVEKIKWSMERESEWEREQEHLLFLKVRHRHCGDQHSSLTLSLFHFKHTHTLSHTFPLHGTLREDSCRRTTNTTDDVTNIRNGQEYSSDSNNHSWQHTELIT